jgi:ADP-heptose:LPS heptosyltransferase
MDKIIFFHMNQLGDLLFSLPVLKAAKEELGSQNYSIISKDLAPILIASGLVGGFCDKSNYNMGLIRKEKFNKAVLFSESPNSLLYAYFSKIKERIGFRTASLSFLLTKKVNRVGVPSLLNNRQLGVAFGLKSVPKDYTHILNVPQDNVNNVLKWFKINNLDVSKTIAISVGASKKRQDKCLEDDKWVKIIDILSENGLSCVLFGAKWEYKSLETIAQKCKITPKLFTAQGGILDSAAFLGQCSLFLGIDSGAMHLAASVGTKCVAVFGYTDPAQVGPMPIAKHIIIKKENIKLIRPEDIIDSILYKK